MQDWREDCLDLTGYKAHVVERLGDRLRTVKPLITDLQIFVALALIHSNFSGRVLSIVMRPYIGKHVEEHNLRRSYWGPVFRANAAFGSMAKENKRFQVHEPNFPNVTWITDGVPVYVRGNATLFNGKHHDKYFLFEVAIMMDGTPLAWQGPFEGREHDSTCTADRPWFRHKKTELGMGDMAFGGIQHYLTQVKLSKAKRELTEDENTFDRDFRRVRNRIEHFFASIDHHRFLWYNEHGMEWNQQAFGLMFNAECIKCEGIRVKVNNDHTPMYPTVKFEDVESEHVDTWEAAEDCTCTFPKLANKSEGANTIRDYRDELTRWIACNVKSILSKPPKRANPNHVPKESLTRKQRREKWGDARDKRKEELKKRKRKGKGKKKSTKVKENTNKKKVIDTNPRKKMIFDDQDDV